MPQARAAVRVAEAASALGLDIRVVELPDSARTAEEAAAACGCAVAKIVKSLVFRGATSGKPVLLLVAGSNRVDEAVVAGPIGEALERMPGKEVREATGFAIGGIPPFGHATKLVTVMDEDLLAFDTVWAAAGTPRHVFAAPPAALCRAAGARVADFTA